MGMFMCEICDQLLDGDFIEAIEWEDGMACIACHCESTPENYEDWILTYWAKPIPLRAFDYELTHKDYDPTPIESGGPPGDDRHFTGPSALDVWQQAIEYEETNEVMK